jgi:hypothetical protein
MSTVFAAMLVTMPASSVLAQAAQHDHGQQAQAQDQTQSAKDPMSMMTGFLGGMMSSFIDPIRIGLQESVRRVTVRVAWDESGRPDQTIEVVQYLTDPSKLQLGMLTGGGPAPTLGGPAPGGAPNIAPKLPGMP